MTDPVSEPAVSEETLPTPSTDSFVDQADLQAPSLAREFWDFLKHNKKWWLGPIVITLLVVSALLLVGGSAAPFIYALF